MSVESPIVHLKASRVLVCGTESGGLEIRDGKSLQLLQSLSGHAGVISDMDVIGNTVATCGGSIRYAFFYLAVLESY